MYALNIISSIFMDVEGYVCENMSGMTYRYMIWWNMLFSLVPFTEIDKLAESSNLQFFLFHIDFFFQIYIATISD